MEGNRPTPKREVVLDPAARARLEAVARNGAASAKRIAHARVLLMADRDHPAGRYPDAKIAAALGLHENTVARVRRLHAEGGEAAALDRRPRLTPPVPPKLDGAGEAVPVAACCSPPPAGRARWTMTLLADELVRRGVVVSISDEAVRVRLKKTSCSPGGPSGSASPGGTCRGSSPRWRRCSTPTPSR
jgi:hypothetical protein